jgi:uncharacterized protein involved in propanediol utilization
MSFIVVDPTIMNEKEARRQGRKSFCGKVWSLTKLVGKACKLDKSLLIGIIAASICRNSTMLQQITFNKWLNTFVTSGLLTSKEEKNLWQ